MKIQDLQKTVIKFRSERNWEKRHKPKDSALSLLLEAAEVLELFQWKSDEEVSKQIKRNSKFKKALAEELSDVLYWVLIMAYDFDIHLPDAFLKKMEKNKRKYPVEVARGKTAKR